MKEVQVPSFCALHLGFMDLALSACTALLAPQRGMLV